MLCKAWLLLLLAWLVAARHGHAGELTSAIYHNGILAFEQARYDEFFRHWFLYQSLDESEKTPELEAKLLTLLWASVDQLDLCPEDLPADHSGSHLWPLVLYNYLAEHGRNRVGKNTAPANTVASFAKGVQSRRIAWHHVLDPQEILSFRSYRDSCSLPGRLMEDNTFMGWVRSPSSMRIVPKVRAEAMLRLIDRIEERTRFQSGHDWIKMRKLGLRLYIIDQKDGVDPASRPLILDLMRADQEFLGALEPELRFYILQLYDRIEDMPEHRRELLLRWLDLATELEDAALLDRVLYSITVLDPEQKLTIWRHERGLRLLQLSEKQLFSEGVSIALARALAAYDKRDMIESLRMFALATRLAPMSRAEGGERIALDWIKHILIQYRFDQRFLDFLRSYLPKAHLKAMIQDVIWTSALLGERAVLDRRLYDDYLNYRLKQIHPYLQAIAQRRFNDFMSRFRKGLQEEPRPTMAFAQDIAEHVRLEPYPVLQALLPLLDSIHKAIDQAIANKQLRVAKSAAVLESYDSLLMHGQRLSQEQADRQVKSGGVIELGAIRVPPARVIPWNFPQSELVLIDVFQKIPYRLQHTHQAQEVEVTWHLGHP